MTITSRMLTDTQCQQISRSRIPKSLDFQSGSVCLQGKLISLRLGMTYWISSFLGSGASSGRRLVHAKAEKDAHSLIILDKVRLIPLNLRRIP